MTCGLCGSGISAQEKFKKQKSGEVRRHVYYGCTRSKDKNCKYSFINEADLIRQFEKLVETIDLNEIEIKEKIRTEVERFKKFQKMLLGVKEKIEVGEIDIRNYMKYILIDGSDIEKREILSSIKGNIVLKEKVISIIKRNEKSRLQVSK